MVEICDGVRESKQKTLRPFLDYFPSLKVIASGTKYYCT